MVKISEIFHSHTGFIEVNIMIMTIGVIVSGDVTGNQVQNSTPNEQELLIVTDLGFSVFQ